jgi:hypothetical protein
MWKGWTLTLFLTILQTEERLSGMKVMSVERRIYPVSGNEAGFTLDVVVLAFAICPPAFQLVAGDFMRCYLRENRRVYPQKRGKTSRQFNALSNALLLRDLAGSPSLTQGTLTASRR